MNFSSFSNLVKRWLWLLVLVNFSALIIGILSFRTAEPLYTAQMTVAPPDALGSLRVTSNTMGSVAGLGLSSLLGGENLMAEYRDFLEVINSYRLLEALDQDGSLRKVVFSKRWDSNSKSWRERTGLTGWIKDRAEDILGIERAREPTLYDLRSFFVKRMQVSRIRDTNFREITFEFKDPDIALDILNRMSDTADRLIRADHLERSLIYAGEISRQLETAQNTEQRSSLLRIVSEQLQRQALTRVDLPYSARTLDGPIVSPRPTSPNLVLTLGGWIIFGICLSGLILFILAKRELRQRQCLGQ